MSKKILIGLLGLGTVGGGVVKVLKKFDNVEIKKIAEINLAKIKNIPGLSPDLVTDNAEMIVNDPDIKIVVEAIGGINPALDFIKKAINNHKHIVTANKELIAKHGEELFELAKAKNVIIMYEAAVAGGIPIVMPLKLSLAGNSITKIAGILNGTTNYIITKMEQEGSDFEDILKEAQALGYAEADPSGDVQGHDAAYKIAILSSLAFNKRIDINKIFREGIDKISPVDIDFAAEFGHTIKLIALGQNGINGTVDVRVHPMFVPKSHPLAHINGVLNGIVVEGDAVGRIMFSGPGAGELPTASSVVGDILTLAHELSVTEHPLPAMQCRHTSRADIMDINETQNKYYIRVKSKNVPGIIGRLGSICGNNNINLNSVIQKGILEDGSARIVLLTDIAYEKDVRKAIKEIEEPPTISKVENLIRVM